MSGCVFCRVASEGGDALVLDEAGVFALLDHRPLFKGHVLVCPRRHAETLDLLDTDEVATTFGAVQRAMRALTGEEIGAQGTFVAANNGVSQSVAHVHVHVVPRTRGDGLRGFFWPRTRYDDAADLERWQQRVRDAIAAAS